MSEKNSIGAIVRREFRTPLGRDDLDIYIRNKRPAGVEDFGPARTLLFVHGAWHGAWCWAEHFLDFFAAQGYAAAQGRSVTVSMSRPTRRCVIETTSQWLSTRRFTTMQSRA